jgi:hypothetical protein
LNGHLALENLLSRELSDGTLSLAWSGKVDKGISDWALGAWVFGDGGGFAVKEIMLAYIHEVAAERCV